MSRAEFWDLTPRELVREFVVALRQAVRDDRERVTQAWQTGLFAGLAWQGKLPRLREVLRAGAPPTVDEQAAQWRAAGFAVMKHNRRKTRIIRMA